MNEYSDLYQRKLIHMYIETQRLESGICTQPILNTGAESVVQNRRSGPILTTALPLISPYHVESHMRIYIKAVLATFCVTIHQISSYAKYVEFDITL